MRALKTILVSSMLVLASAVPGLAQSTSVSASASASASASPDSTTSPTASASASASASAPSGSGTSSVTVNGVSVDADAAATASAGATQNITDAATQGTDVALKALAGSGSPDADGSALAAISDPDPPAPPAAPPAAASSVPAPSSAPPDDGTASDGEDGEQASPEESLHGITALPETGGATVLGPWAGILLVGAGLVLVRRRI